MSLPKKPSKAFTLIELLIVITIIAVLLGAISFSYNAAQRKGRDGKRKADLKTVQQALEQFFTVNGTYPPSDGSGRINCDNASNLTKYNNSTITWGNTFQCQNTSGSPQFDNFLTTTPRDPSKTTANDYFYRAIGSGPFLTYQLEAKLENPNDPDYTAADACDIVSPKTSYQATYCVHNP